MKKLLLAFALGILINFPLSSQKIEQRVMLEIGDSLVQLENGTDVFSVAQFKSIKDHPKLLVRQVVYSSDPFASPKISSSNYVVSSFYVTAAIKDVLCERKIIGNTIDTATMKWFNAPEQLTKVYFEQVYLRDTKTGLMIVVGGFSISRRPDYFAVVGSHDTIDAYVGVDNFFDIAMTGADYYLKMDVKSDGLDVNFDSTSSSLMVRPDKAGVYPLFVFNNGKCLDTLHVRCSAVPLPALCFGTLGPETTKKGDGSVVTIDELSRGHLLVANQIIHDPNYPQYKIRSYEACSVVIIYQGKQKTFSLEKTGMLSQSCLDYIRTCKKGNVEILFTDVVLDGPASMRTSCKLYLLN